MKSRKYKVVFMTGHMALVKSFGIEEAIILAKAEMIKNGLDFEVERESCREINDKSYEIYLEDADFVL